MTFYFTVVATELLPALRDGDRMPKGFRLQREIGTIDYGKTLVLFEDDEAPAYFEGKLVTPSFVTDQGGVRIMDRTMHLSG